MNTLYEIGANGVFTDTEYCECTWCEGHDSEIPIVVALTVEAVDEEHAWVLLREEVESQIEQDTADHVCYRDDYEQIKWTIEPWLRELSESERMHRLDAPQLFVLEAER